jgi:hypothetical protein
MGDALDFLRLSATQMFQLPAVLTMAVAATRMHRSLAYVAHRPSDACVIFHRFDLLLTMEDIRSECT